MELDDGLILTCESPVKDLRASCRLLGISQAGSKGKMFERIKKSYVQGMRRAAIDMARAEYQREEHPAQPAHLAVRQPTHRDRSLHELTRLPYRDWCPFCVSTRARGDYHASHADPDLAAARDRPTIQVDFYFCENRDKSEGSLGVKPILLMVDSWTRYAHAKPIKPKNAKTVGSAISKFVGSLGYVGAVEVCGDNENVLVSGMEFFKQVRARQGFSTTVTTNRNYSKGRTSICERTVQTVRNLQKTLVVQLEESIKCKIPQGHAVLYWAAMHSTWLYNRYLTHSTTKITPYQAVNGRPYHNRIACFGQVTYGLDPKGSKYPPTWKKGMWLGKDGSDHDVLATAAGTITRTRSIRRTALTWSADEILSLVIGPWDTTGYTQSKVKQKPVLALPPRPFFDEEAEAVKGLQDSDDEREQAQQEVQSNAYEPTTPDGEGPRLEDVTEQDDGRVPVPSLPPLCAVPVDPGMEAPQTPEEMLMSGAGGASPSSPTMDVDSSGHAASKHKAETQRGTVAKALKFDSDPVPEPKVKAAKMDVRRVGEVEITHNDVIGLEDDWEFLPYEDVDSEGEGINKRLEEDGPPTVSPEKLAELDAQAALDEVAKLYECT